MMGHNHHHQLQQHHHHQSQQLNPGQANITTIVGMNHAPSSLGSSISHAHLLNSRPSSTGHLTPNSGNFQGLLIGVIHKGRPRPRPKVWTSFLNDPLHITPTLDVFLVNECLRCKDWNESDWKCQILFFPILTNSHFFLHIGSVTPTNLPSPSDLRQNSNMGMPVLSDYESNTGSSKRPRISEGWNS